MSDASADPDVTELLADLTRELQRLQREVEPDRERPLRRDLARFTSEVAIPGLILLLKTNIQALELLRRAIRIAEGREPRGERARPEVRERAERLGQVTLARLDDVLSELQGAVEGRPNDDRSVQLIEEARTIRQQIQEELDADVDREDVDEVNIDVEAELRALKDDLDEGGDRRSNDGDSGGRSGSDGSRDGGTGDDGSRDGAGDGSRD